MDRYKLSPIAHTTWLIAWPSDLAGHQNADPQEAKGRPGGRSGRWEITKNGMLALL